VNKSAWIIKLLKTNSKSYKKKDLF